MSRPGNDLVYLLLDPARRGQFRPSRRAGAEMLAMAAPDDSRLSGLASRTAAAGSRYGARYPPYLHRRVTASVHFRGFTAIVTVVWGWLSLLPCP